MNLENYTQDQKILIAVDCIIFGFDGDQLKALLVKRGFEPEKGRWSLMGGFISKNETADEAASRVLQQLTGMTQVYMEQLHVFSGVDRDKAGRVLSIAYFALINIHEYSGQLQSQQEARWFPLDEIPRLIFDHDAMVDKAKDLLRQKVVNQPIGFELLPPKFTLRKLQNLYEAIYNTELDKRNFTKKMLSLGVLNRLTEKEKQSSRKGSYYYVFDYAKYNELQSTGLRFL